MKTFEYWENSHRILQISKSAPQKIMARPPFTDRNYRKTFKVSRTLVGSKSVDHSDVVGASPVGAAPTTSSFST